jgi:hypothetical protein
MALSERSSSDGNKHTRIQNKRNKKEIPLNKEKGRKK